MSFVFLYYIKWKLWEGISEIMGFIDEVNSVKENVLKKTEYSDAINSIMAKANEYSTQERIKKSLENPEEELIH